MKIIVAAESVHLNFLSIQTHNDSKQPQCSFLPYLPSYIFLTPLSDKIKIGPFTIEQDDWGKS